MISSQQIATAAPGGISPSSMEFSPDGGLLTYLYPEDSSGQRQVFYVDCADATMSPKKFSTLSSSTSTDVSPEEQARRERMRLFAGGMMKYQWNGKTSVDQEMIVPFSGRVLLAHKDGNYEVLYDAEKGTCTDPTLSPDGSSIACVIEQDMYIMDKKVGSARGMERLTWHGSQDGVSCGLADYLAQEEMDRYEGFWWSPDSTLIAYTETNENNVPSYTIPHPGKADPKMKESHNYPFAGYENAKVQLAVLKARGNPAGSRAEDLRVMMDLTGSGKEAGDLDPNDYYLGRVGWWPDVSVMAQVENRVQNKLQLLKLDPSTGARTVLVEESSEFWVNLHDLLYTFPSGWAPEGDKAAAPGDFYFLWASERSGYCQLYLYHYQKELNSCRVLLDGKPIGGGGAFVVEDISAVDTVNRVVYFTGNRGSAIEKHLYAASFASTEEAGAIKEITAHVPGVHTVAVSVEKGLVADIHSSADHAFSLSVYEIDPKTIVTNRALPRKAAIVYDEERSFADSAASDLAKTLTRPVFDTIRSLDGQVDLHCALYLPDKSKFGPGPYPCVCDVYGGPHVMRVLNTWQTTANLRVQRLVQLGCMVMRCDNRGSYRRGIAFEGAIHRNMGYLEVEDQCAAVNHFAAEGLINPGKVGMIGWSYGGYLTAMSLCRAPKTFCCGVVGAPVTSWDGYDTHYTERYMGLPAENELGYSSSSVMTHVENYSGRMMLVHGLIDENVHFRHTARLINKLVEARKCYDLMLFPCERHSPHGTDNRVYLEDGILSFFLLHLGGEGGAGADKAAAVVPKADMVAANAAGTFLPSHSTSRL